MYVLLKRISFVSTKDSFYSDDWKEVLVSESEYYTNDILLRSPTLLPTYCTKYSRDMLYYTRTIPVFYLSQVSTKEKWERETGYESNVERLFPTTFFRFLLVEKCFLVWKIFYWYFLLRTFLVLKLVFRHFRV